jgi:2-dehydro-3-deoxyglucarate aldolase
MNRLLALSVIRTRLRNGGVSIGSWIQIPHPSIAEILGQAGYDWVAVDMEHGSIGHNQLPDLFRALELGNTMPLVRLSECQPKDCKQALDAGAGGVIVPMVETAEQLELVRDACRWPPAGKRGVGFSRANLFGKHFDAYSEESQAPFLVAMVEHVRAVENLEAILAVEGLDAILIGPYDLSASMGITGQFNHPNFTAAMHQIAERTTHRSIPAGLHVVESSKVQLDQRIGEGFRFLAFSIDAVFLRAGAQNPTPQS